MILIVKSKSGEFGYWICLASDDGVFQWSSEYAFLEAWEVGQLMGGN